MAGLDIQQDAFQHVAFDMVPDTGLGVEADEDLIDYDSDVGEKDAATNEASWHQSPTTADVVDGVQASLATGIDDPEPAEENNEHEVALGEGENLLEQAPSTDGAESALVAIETRDEDLTQDFEVAHDPSAATGADNHFQEEDLFDLEPERADIPVAEEKAVTEEQAINTSQQINNLSTPSQEGNQIDHEIDYEMDEPDVTSPTEHQNEPSLQDDQFNEQPEIAEDSFAQQATAEHDESGLAQDDDLEHDVSQVAEHEIMWEVEEDVLEDTKSGNEANVAKTDNGDASLLDREAQTDASQQNEEAPDAEDPHDKPAGVEEEYEQNDPAVQDHGSEDASAATPGEEYGLTTAHSETEAVEAAETPGFPSITVQYKGDEFPFFSASSDGFFADPAVLDGDMKSLMAGFRAELMNEIASDEELVFQVDELGLEFAESSLETTLSTVTMRQVLDVFDILVKNQDPDSSRVLYTYLFTRPNTSKRFESLVESATAGKGLDEVIHLFASPMPHGNRVVIQSTQGSESHDGDYETYESAEDMEQDEEEHLEQIPARSTTGDLDYEDGDANPGDEAPEGSGLQLQGSGSPAHDEPAPAAAQDLDPSVQAEGDEHSSVPEVDFEEVYSDQQDMPPIATAEDLGATDEGSLAIPVEADGEVVHAETVEAETMAILEEDGDANPTLADTDFDLNADHEFSQKVLEEQDELAEIDWQSDVGDAEESADNVHPPGKRPRTDDEVPVDDEKDAKRLRS